MSSVMAFQVWPLIVQFVVASANQTKWCGNGDMAWHDMAWQDMIAGGDYPVHFVLTRYMHLGHGFGTHAYGSIVSWHRMCGGMKHEVS